MPDHRRLAHLWGRFACPECDAPFDLLKDLTRHMYDSNHDKNPLVKCTCKLTVDIMHMPEHYLQCVERQINMVQRGRKNANRDQLYKNRSSRKIDSRRLFSSKQDFPKTFCLTENQYYGKAYFSTIASCRCSYSSMHDLEVKFDVQVDDEDLATIRYGMNNLLQRISDIMTIGL